ncbi:alpha/beta hydrolase [Nocardia yamanashiensis]|uniref:alpha/beta hydrolase n=1 Tax=Nocardia yamanashiensis TaxID=209247 RepID=UPI001E4AA8A4|nr:alpha/beta hydrolase [Nocardia yamanashiensis]UGT39803.1 alpha/beta hydrolase [Nocardia yamanashiensis]
MGNKMFGALLAVVVSAGVLCAGQAGAAPSASLKWQPCQENSAFDCATLPVPIDWADPGGAGIDIAVVIDRVDDPSRRIGTLVSLPGGPGSSGVDQILGGAGFSDELRARFDIVSIDPRGVGRSHPVRCDAGLAADRPGLDPDAGALLPDVRSYAAELAAGCREHTGPLMDHLDAKSVARDVDALRNALGENKVSLYSRSYGTMSAQAYAELFPQNLRASLLDSVDDHSLDGAGFLALEARAGQDTFDEFANWCARDTTCVLHGTDVRATYRALWDAATRGELRTPGKPDRPLRPLDLSQQVTQRLYHPDWAKLAGDLQTLTATPKGSPEPVTTPRATGTAAPFPAIIFCSDWQFDIPDQARWQSLWTAQHANAPTLGAHFAWAAGSLCSAWPTPPANPPHRPTVQNSPPTLILNSRHDPATPLEWAIQVAAQTPATLLTYDGWGHGIYDRNACTTSAADRYLTDLTMPATTSCPA